MVGAVAQLVERVVRNDEVRGSIPLRSTNLFREDFLMGYGTGTSMSKIGDLLDRRDASFSLLRWFDGQNHPKLRFRGY
jgi:hypothetical protein